MLNIFKKKDAVDVFWKWFVAKRAKFDELGPDMSSEQVHDLLGRISGELRKITDGLLVEVSKTPEGFRELTITAEGETEKFSAIVEIVEKAPDIPGWKITAFRQRMGTGFVLKAETIKLDVGEMFFLPVVEGDAELDIIVYAENLAGKEEEMVAKFVFVLMDNLLGEYDCAMKVNRFGYRDLAEAEDEDLIPLAQLPDFIDEFYRNSNN